MNELTLGPVEVEAVADKCYESYIIYRGAANQPDFSIYVPRHTLPDDAVPYRIIVRFESPRDTHWKRFTSGSYFDRCKSL